MAVKAPISFFSPKLSQQKLSIHNFHSFLSNGQLKFNSDFKSRISKLFLKSQKPHQTLKFQSHKNQINCLFTGIVEEMGKVKQLGYGENGGFDLKIGAKTVLEDVKLGDSISVNGTCLTVTEFNTESSEFTVGLAPETLRKTSLIELEPGSFVNLERALLPSTRMGGHFVQVSFVYLLAFFFVMIVLKLIGIA
ncbi:Riboflavin synthase [Bienertia sinuspersici]